MLLKNSLNYSPAIVNAAQTMLYKPIEGRISVTDLINPPLIRQLKLKYWDTLEIDVDDILVPMFGVSFHQYLSKFESADAICEKHLEAKIGNIVLAGKTDVIREDTIEDNKVTSAWSFVFGKDEWIDQLNVYAWLARQHGHDIKKLVINAFLKDWSQFQVWQDKSGKYPPTRFFRIELPVWPQDKQDNYVKSRVALHTQPATECSDEEKWAKEDSYAVMKKGRKSAIAANSYTNGEKTPLTYKAALSYIKKSNWENNDDYYIQKRPGECVRCNRYCIVRSICEFNKGE